MKKKTVFTFLLILSAFHVLKAQYDAQFSNYWAVQGYFNPAVAGQTNNLEATALYRLQWLGMPGAPQTMLVLADMPQKFLGRTHGLGVSFLSEGIGLFDHKIFSLQYAYKKKLWNGDFSVGLQASMISEDFDGTKVHIPADSEAHEENDDAIPREKVSGTAYDFSFGLYYKQKKWYAGLSALHLFQPETELADNRSYIYASRTYFLMGGYNIQLNNPLIELQQSTFVKTDLMTTMVDLNMRVCYNKMLWAGLGWRVNDAAILTLGAKFGKIQGGYAYDFPVTAIRKGTTGSHELFLRYSMDLNRGKGNKNKHKSVRIL